jgi:uncharacterized protein
MRMMNSMETADEEMSRISAEIRGVFTRRDRVKAAMEAWYENRRSGQFPQMDELLLLDERLSQLDSRFKFLWDQQQMQQQSQQ